VSRAIAEQYIRLYGPAQKNPDKSGYPDLACKNKPKIRRWYKGLQRPPLIPFPWGPLGWWPRAPKHVKTALRQHRQQGPLRESSSPLQPLCRRGLSQKAIACRPDDMLS